LARLTARIALGVFRVTAPKSTATGASVATGTNGMGAVPVPERSPACSRRAWI